ncbi:ribonucleoside-diphosphate reductase subunit alpha [Cocleimonas flava]|uniref:Ribonucleoside-diphosphate reductase n=1 Tax=Cocleimonas flava TaxID=634765 RepID=A0A4R1EP18_9GAMM|nr:MULTISPECIES: ribonucleoside-diphosphate reductase subunit alpha [Cocleimonas]MEB8432582.1 ribonucleoside-diphosphate reductase subunit alpha [Cocleimonas sp. KMM 6892]MEC4715441.1 ribonucleoside-diphosphate reductase subunit alpha [Cocleimonas sp. KMM 6895]MEC4744940.1 ribonucleoside-diphosphate reductase subunit alpha [Cocleimonas sp. KMM 6896]TCJ83017.1 ribonucleoside-diphosphate reductase alpha chain [Cocleimonas flava]
MQSGSNDNFANTVIDDSQDPQNKSVLTDAIDETMQRTSAQEDAVYKVVRRNGKVTPFDRSKIEVALTKAFLGVEGGVAAASSRIHDTVRVMAQQVNDNLFRRMPDGGVVHIEDIQDQVELALMRSGERKVARAYVIYREDRAHARAEKAEQTAPKKTSKKESINITTSNGDTKPLDRNRLRKVIAEAVSGLHGVDQETVEKEALRNLFDGIPEEDVGSALVMATRVNIDKDSNYSMVAARLLLDNLRTEALTYLNGRHTEATQAEMAKRYPATLKKYIKQAVELELLDEELTRYDLTKLGAALKPERDHQFTYLGLQTLYDRYFIHTDNDVRFELPQIFFMRVSMGLAINEVNREERAIEFYNLLSSFNFMSSTPTLFNSGTRRPQLSSCYLTTVPDSLDGIYSSIKDDALLSKYAGGLGNDWTRVRGLGSHIKGTNGKSQGVVPFLKVTNDTAVAVNQGGKRKGAICAYLETWHVDIEEFIELRKNTGDERRRTHDMNSANWIPDLFMQRVAEEGEWTLFSPEEVPDLHDLSGKAFKEAYEAYEEKAARGDMSLFKKIKAVDLWRKMLGMLFETGHPWITFKDPCNIRYSNQHVGVVHSSNLCTEIMLHTNDDEIAVCNLGSVNIAAHTTENGIDMPMLEKTITTAMRMLDNVIEYNYYSVPQARNSNMQHRPVGLGLMGFQDALYKQDIPYASQQAVEFADRSMEAVSYYAIQTSSELAKERGTYPSYDGSLWSQGILPIDSIELMEEQRGEYYQVDKSTSLDWSTLREHVKEHGMRNSNTMAIAPTATISNICGVSQSIEPTYQNMFVKSNLSGEFTVINPYMVNELKDLGLWDEVMINDLKYFDGSVQQIDRIPENLKAKYATAFEVDSRWLIEAGSRRQKWIDQGQSLNLYMQEPSGAKLDNLYKLAWVRGLKTTYYLRSMGATAMEKTQESSSNVRENVAPEAPESVGSAAPAACSILDPDCDACQ